MMGSFLTRALVMVLGYAYPAYECYKTVELNNPGIEQLRFWCQYWILVALLTVFERVGDAFISWLPMYSEAKLAFFVYLWYPKTKGTTYVYDTFFRPYVSRHENEIDRNLLELRTRAGDIVVLYWQKAAIYGQTRFFEILQYVASQSQTSRARPVQQQQQVRQAPPPAVPPRQSAAAATAAVVPPRNATAAATAAVVPPRNATAASATSEVQPSSPLKSSQVEEAAPKSTSRAETATVPIAAKQDAAAAMQADEAATTSADPDADPPAGETAMEEAVRVTRARLRKRVAGGPAGR